MKQFKPVTEEVWLHAMPFSSLVSMHTLLLKVAKLEIQSVGMETVRGSSSITDVVFEQMPSQ